LALFVALGGTGYAATQIDGSKIKDGSVSGSKLTNHTVGRIKLKKKAIAALKGKQGPPGVPATRLWAVISGADGSRVPGRSSGVTQSGCLQAPCNATYGLTFNRDISKCSYSATRTSASGANVPGGEITAAQRATGSAYTKPNQLVVATFDSSGSLENSDFSVQVFC
jgi:hypothetical protein